MIEDITFNQDHAADRPSREELQDRLAAVRYWQSQGLGRQEVTRNAMAEWRVSQRTAQKYLRRVERSLARPMLHDERLPVLRLSQLQRERLLSKISERLVEPSALDVKTLVQLVNAARVLIDARDRAARALGELQDDAQKEAEPTRERPKRRKTHSSEKRENVAHDEVPPVVRPASGGLKARREPTIGAVDPDPRDAAHGECRAAVTPPADELALRERCADIMEEMEAMMSISKREMGRNNAMGRDGGERSAPGPRPASLGKSKPDQGLRRQQPHVRDGT